MILVSGVLVAALAVGTLVELGDESGGNGLWSYEFKRTDAGDHVYYLDYESKSERIEITAISNVDRKFAEQTIKEKVFLFGSLFEKQRVGYPGQHTEYIECKPEFKPVYSEASIEGGSLRYFNGFASNRFAFGACDEQSVAYSAVNAYVYCEDEKTIYDISYFSLARSAGDTARFIRGIRCH